MESHQTVEGTWACDSAIVDGKPLPEATTKLLRLTLTKDRYKTERGTETLFESSYALDAAHVPARIDILGTEGDFKGRNALGIYSLAEDRLTICYTMPGQQRPGAFESSPGSGAFLVVWKRHAG